jgi:general secretion pathway protein G
MVVVIILGILAATIVPQFGKATQEAKFNRAKADIAQLETQIEYLFLHMDRYPQTEEGLEILVTPPGEGGDKWRGPYLKEVRPDPWGNPYRYRSPGLHGSKTYDLWSTGADGADGGEDVNTDVKNWSE